MESLNLENIVNTNQMPQTCLGNVAYDIMSSTNHNFYNANGEMKNLCNCTIIDVPNGSPLENAKCPTGQFVTTNYPLLNKVECCSECDVNPVKYIVPDGCEPNKHFATDIAMFYDNPYINTEYKVANKQLDNTCSETMMNNEICNETKMTSLKDKCTLYEIDATNCTADNIKNVEQNCAAHELKYYDDKLGLYVNINSPFYCHNNLTGMDNYCKSNGITNCNVTNLTKSIEQSYNKPNVTPVVESMDGKITSEIIDTSSVNNNNLYFLLFVCLILLFILGGFYFYKKKKYFIIV